MKRILLSIFAFAVAPLAVAQTETPKLAIDANEDSLTATLTYRGAVIDVFGFADDFDPETGRLAISVVGPEAAQELRILERNALGLVTQGPATSFGHLPGFWALHATPASEQLEEVTAGDFDRLPHVFQGWAFEQVKTQPANAGLGGNAMQAQVFNGRLSVENQVDLRANGLFNTTLNLPAFAPVGEYVITAHWFREDGEHQVSAPKTLVVQRGQIASWITDASRSRAFIYGLICVFIAVFAGLASELVFRRFAP